MLAHFLWGTRLPFMQTAQERHSQFWFDYILTASLFKQKSLPQNTANCRLLVCVWSTTLRLKYDSLNAIFTALNMWFSLYIGNDTHCTEGFELLIKYADSTFFSTFTQIALQDPSRISLNFLTSDLSKSTSLCLRFWRDEQ